MRRPPSWVGFLLVAFLLLVQRVCAQSLGDIARQQREKNKQQITTSNKVITNEDISTPGESAEAPSTDLKKKKSTKQKPSTGGETSEKDDDPPSAEELKASIQEKKEGIAKIQARINEIQSTIGYVQNNRNIYTNAPEYNEAQKRKEQQVNRLKGILQEQQNELQELQETARKAGYGSAVYD